MLRPIHTLLLTVLVLAGLATAQASADEVTDWTQIMLAANHTASASAPVASRNGAIVEASVFDAVNGVKGHTSQCFSAGPWQWKFRRHRRLSAWHLPDSP